MFKKILIANRGEIALRIHRAAQGDGHSTVAVHSDGRPRRDACAHGRRERLHRPRPRRRAISTSPRSSRPARSPAPRRSIRATGFLSENASFAQIVAEHGLTFIGPSAEPHPRDGRQDRRQGDHERRLGVPCVPGSEGACPGRRTQRRRAEIGYPVLVKAAAGGGGRGMKLVARAPEQWLECDRAGAQRRRWPRSATMRSIWRSISNARAISRCRCLATARQCRPSRGAGLLAPAPPPEALRGGALARDRRRDARAHRRHLRRRGARHGLRGAGTIEFLTRTASSTSSR